MRILAFDQLDQSRLKNPLFSSLFPGSILEFRKVKQGEQEVLVKLNRHGLQQYRSILDEVDAVS